MTSVIVMMKDDEKGLSPRSTVRARALGAEESPLASELRSSGAGVKAVGSSIPYLVASVSAAQEKALRANPQVQLVVPNVEIHETPSLASPADGALTGAKSDTKTSPSTSGGTPPSICGTPSNPENDPEAISDINATGAIADGYDGAGVTVAFIAGGIDTTIQDFQRNPAYASAGSPAGSPVVSSVNFSGDPSADQGGGAATESFLDASSIASQGNVVYNLNDFISSSQPPLNGGNPCDITITGAAPGASVMGIDVFSDDYYTTESNFLEGIAYAVSNGVKVINESFGSNNFPDTALDATRIADNDAIAAGVAVVVSSGDAGVGNTLGSPATDPNVISAGASTTFRSYEQDYYAGANIPVGNGTWIDNNISALSSSGYSQSGGNTVDLVAPGDLNWIDCSTGTEWAGDCENENGSPSPILLEGGTSESAPLTSAAAADVIQAYSSTHGGNDPSPALIKQILMSTATDIKAPAIEQGAGLLNVLAAVKDAISLPGSNKTHAGDIQFSPNQINITQAPGKSRTRIVTVTNTSSHSETVKLTTRTLTDKIASTTGSFCLNPSSTTISGCGAPTTSSIIIWSGVTEVYQLKTFTVPKTTGPSRLNFMATYPVDNPEQNSLMHVALFAPNGAYAGYSLGQGLADYANVQVADPEPGTWTAAFFTAEDTTTDACSGSPCVGTSGIIHWQADTWAYARAGSISPSSFTLKAGGTALALFTAKSPAASGDTNQSIVLSTVGGATNTIPVTVRTTVPLGKHGGSFSGVLTGGNGRGGAPATTSIFEFALPKGLHNVEVSATWKDMGDFANAYLVNPSGEAVAQSSNASFTSDFDLVATGGFDLYTDQPVAGNWELLVQWINPVSGSELSEPFSGSIHFNSVDVTTTLPNNAAAHLTAGKNYKFYVTVKNTGTQAQTYFLDPRTSAMAAVNLVDLDGDEGAITLPMASEEPYYIVPSDSTGISASVESSAPVTFDLEPFPGDPDLSPALPAPNVNEYQGNDVASLTYSVPSGELEPGFWYLAPSEIGPYGSSGAPAEEAIASVAAVTPGFATNVTSPTGDLWSAANDYSGVFNPVYLAPGHSVKIPVTISATGTPGTTVTGSVKVDDTYAYNFYTGIEGASGDELTSLPFEYTLAAGTSGATRQASDVVATPVLHGAGSVSAYLKGRRD